MIYSTTAGGRWVLFGLLVESRHLRVPQVLFCPSESNPKFIFDTPENPWPVHVVPALNIQSGYGARPEQEIPDDLANPPARLRPFAMPRLRRFQNRAIFADLTASRTRVITRHRSGINVLYGHGGAGWMPLNMFDHPDALWPDPTFPPSHAFNSTQDAIWAALDRG